MKGLIKIALCFIFAVAVSGNVYAKAVPTIFMTDAQGSYDERQPKKFQLTETPWVSVDMQDNSIVSGTWWLASSPKSYDFISFAQDGSYYNGDFTFYNSFAEDRIWFSLTDWLTGVGEPGRWHITGAVLLDGSPQDGRAINYTVEVPNVVPEPVSTILFLTGGSVMGIRIYRKNNNKKGWKQ